MNFLDAILSSTADAAIEALIASVGLASMGGAYQPEEPADLKKVAEMRRESK